MERAGLGVGFAFLVTLLFCGPPPEPPMAPPSQAVESPSPEPRRVVLDAGVADAVEPDSLAAESDAAPRPFRAGLPPDSIRTVVLQHQRALRACYELEARGDPSLRGGVTTSWTIDASGTVITANLVETTVHNANVEGAFCAKCRRGTSRPVTECPR